MLSSLAFIVGWFTTATAFVALMHARKLARDAGLSLFWKVNLMPAATLGYVLDVVLLNWIVGTVIFVELPRWREWTFSERVQRHYRTGSHIAKWWAARLNEIDAEHIKP